MIVLRLIMTFFLLTSIFLASLLQLASLIIRPFSQVAFRRFNARLAAFWWYQLAWVLEKIFKVRVHIGGDRSISAAESALVITNHQSFTDPLIILMMAKEFGSLSCLKWFVKSTIIYVPFLGWGLWFLDCIFLKRDWNLDHEKIKKCFKTIKKFQDPIWLISFVEGTRKSVKKLSASREYAMSCGIQPFKHLLFPRHKGFVANIQGLEDRIDFIYDVTIMYSNPNPGLRTLLRGNLGDVNTTIERIPIGGLNKDPSMIKEWLISQFRKKDAILEHSVVDSAVE